MHLVTNTEQLIQLYKDQENLSWYLVNIPFQQWPSEVTYQFHLAKELPNIKFCSFTIFLHLYNVFLSHHLKELKTSAVPDGCGEKTEFEVFNFTGAGGVALSMYNTDEVHIPPFFFPPLSLLLLFKKNKLTNF